MFIWLALLQTTHHPLRTNGQSVGSALKKKIGILTLIKNSFKSYGWEELIDFPQDIWFGSKRRIFIPDLYNVFAISNANTDANDLII